MAVSYTWIVFLLLQANKKHINIRVIIPNISFILQIYKSISNFSFLITGLTPGDEVLIPTSITIFNFPLEVILNPIETTLLPTT